MCTILYAISTFMLFNCSNENGSGDLLVTWEFATGDCITNKIEKIHVEATSSDGDVLSGETTCSAPNVNIGSAGNKSYTIVAKGYDANGAVRVENYKTTVSFSGNGTALDVKVTLHPKASKIRVNWNGCPSGVVLPYIITLYNVPLQASSSLVDEVSYTQMPCGTSYATLTNIPPGNYIVELDSRAISPKVYGTKPVTVVAGEDTEVTFNLGY